MAIHVVRKLLILALLSSCGANDGEDAEFMWVIHEKNDSYETKKVAIGSFNKPNKLRGKLARILTIKEQNGDSTVSGISPNFIVQNKTLIPIDHQTLMAFTLYKNLETVMNHWTTKLKLKPDELKSISINYGQMELDSSKGFSRLAEEGLNGIFNLSNHQITIFESRADYQVPAAASLGLLAHEMGHFLFDLKCAQQDRNFYLMDTELQMLSIIEGLADFFSWLVTQDSKWLKQFNAYSRRLPGPKTEKQCSFSPYCRGTIIASSLVKTAKSLEMPPDTMGKYIIQSFDLLRTEWKTKRQDNEFAITDYLIILINQAEEAQKPVFCQHFLEWFDSKKSQESLKDICTQ